MILFVLVAVLATVYFLAMAVQRRHPADVLAVLLWGPYAVYEYLVANGTLCDPYCNIRVDLALFLPILIAGTLIALQKEPRTGAVLILAVVCLALAALLAHVFGYPALSVAFGAGAALLAAYGIKRMVAARGV